MWSAAPSARRQPPVWPVWVPVVLHGNILHSWIWRHISRHLDQPAVHADNDLCSSHCVSKTSIQLCHHKVFWFFYSLFSPLLIIYLMNGRWFERKVCFGTSMKNSFFFCFFLVFSICSVFDVTETKSKYWYPYIFITSRFETTKPTECVFQTLCLHRPTYAYFI